LTIKGIIQSAGNLESRLDLSYTVECWALSLTMTLNVVTE